MRIAVIGCGTVVANGARSKLRDLVGSPSTNRGYAWGAHWFVGENRGVFPENELYQVVRGTRQLGGFLAIGRHLDGGEALVSSSGASASPTMPGCAPSRWRIGKTAFSIFVRKPMLCWRRSAIGAR